jgi:hypothetical protein
MNGKRALGGNPPRFALSDTSSLEGGTAPACCLKTAGRRTAAVRTNAITTAALNQ